MEGITLEDFLQQGHKLIKKHPKLAKAIVVFQGETWYQEMFYAGEIVKLVDKEALNEIRTGRSRQTLAVVIKGEETV